MECQVEVQRCSFVLHFMLSLADENVPSSQCQTSKNDIWMSAYTENDKIANSCQSNDVSGAFVVLTITNMVLMTPISCLVTRFASLHNLNKVCLANLVMGLKNR